jgi:tmRNA-binding protein
MNMRGYRKNKIEHIIRFSTERYFDTETRRFVIIGKHGIKDVLIPYDKKGTTIIPVTIHATTRQQIRFRILSGRLEHEK